MQERALPVRRFSSPRPGQGLNIAYYTSLQSADGLSSQISSLGLDVMKQIESGQFKVTSLSQLYRRQLKSAKDFAVLAGHMAPLFQERINFVIFDDVTPEISDDHDSVLNFFVRSHKLSRLGLTVLSSFRSSISKRRLIDQLRDLVDVHLNLSVETQPKGRRMEFFSKLEVKKIDGLLPAFDNKVMFRVNRRLPRLENRSLEVVPATELVS